MRSFEIRDAPDELAEITRKPSLGPLQGQHFGLAQELALEKRLLVLQLFGKEREAFVGGFHLGFVTADALLQPCDLPFEYQHLGCQTGSAGHKFGVLASEDRLDLGVVRPVRREICGHCECRASVHFGFEPGLHRKQAVFAQNETAKLGVRRRVIHAHKHLVGINEIAFLN